MVTHLDGSDSAKSVSHSDRYIFDFQPAPIGSHIHFVGPSFKLTSAVATNVGS